MPELFDLPIVTELVEAPLRDPGCARFAETRALAEQWIYRYLRTAYQWALNEKTGLDRIGVGTSQVSSAPVLSWPATEQARMWARQVGLDAPICGPVRPEIFMAWQRTHPRS